MGSVIQLIGSLKKQTIFVIILAKQSSLGKFSKSLRDFGPRGSLSLENK